MAIALDIQKQGWLPRLIVQRVGGLVTKKTAFERFDLNKLFKRTQYQTNSLSPSRFERTYLITDQEFPDTITSKFDKVIGSLEALEDAEIKGSAFYIYFLCDSDALPILTRIRCAGGKFIPPLNFSRTFYRFTNRLAFNSLKRTWSKEDRISHLKLPVHENICEALEITKDVEGDYVEIGVYLGGSALTAMNYIAEAGRVLQRPKRKCWLLDTFDGFNYLEATMSPDVIWEGTHKLYGVEKTMDHIEETLRDVGVPFELVKANICASDLPPSINKIAVANIDVDMYDATLAALNKVAPLIQPGGIIIAEDPTETPGLYGAYLALNEFLESSVGKHFISLFKEGQYFLIRVGDGVGCERG